MGDILLNRVDGIAQDCREEILVWLQSAMERAASDGKASISIKVSLTDHGNRVRVSSRMTGPSLKHDGEERPMDAEADMFEEQSK